MTLHPYPTLCLAKDIKGWDGMHGCIFSKTSLIDIRFAWYPPWMVAGTNSVFLGEFSAAMSLTCPFLSGTFERESTSVAICTRAIAGTSATTLFSVREIQCFHACECDQEEQEPNAEFGHCKWTRHWGGITH